MTATRFIINTGVQLWSSYAASKCTHWFCMQLYYLPWSRKQLSWWRDMGLRATWWGSFKREGFTYKAHTEPHVGLLFKGAFGSQFLLWEQGGHQALPHNILMASFRKSLLYMYNYVQIMFIHFIVIGYVQMNHNVAKTQLVDAVNDKCANCRRKGKK